MDGPCLKWRRINCSNVNGKIKAGSVVALDGSWYVVGVEPTDWEPTCESGRVGDGFFPRLSFLQFRSLVHFDRRSRSEKNWELNFFFRSALCVRRASQAKDLVTRSCLCWARMSSTSKTKSEWEREFDIEDGGTSALLVALTIKMFAAEAFISCMRETSARNCADTLDRYVTSWGNP